MYFEILAIPNFKQSHCGQTGIEIEASDRIVRVLSYI